MRKGFSLVELMIVVAIIGILAAIAIPNFVAMQLKAKRSEVPGNVDGIKTAEAAYEASYDAYIATTLSPASGSGGGGKSPVAWVDAGNFATLGWKPDGNVRGQYEVSIAGGSCGDHGTITATTDFCAHGQSDVDGDSTKADYYASALKNTDIVDADAGVY